jgi:uncharacterized protein (DUF1499 family)
MSVRYSRCSKPRTRRLRYWPGIVLVASLFVMAAQDNSHAPVANCLETPNCVLESREFSVPSETLFAAAIRALDRIAPASVEVSPDRTRLVAVFRVFLFRDDVHVVIENMADEQTTLHFRSSSRSGRWDAGVNARRARSFFRHLDRVLEEMSGQR